MERITIRKQIEKKYPDYSGSTLSYVGPSDRSGEILSPGLEHFEQPGVSTPKNGTSPANNAFRTLEKDTISTPVYLPPPAFDRVTRPVRGGDDTS